MLKFALIWEVTFGSIYLFEMFLHFTLLRWNKWVVNTGLTEEQEKETHFIKSHTILDKESYPLIEVAYIALQDEVLLRLR